MNPLLIGLLGAALGTFLFASDLAVRRRIAGMLRVRDLRLLKMVVTAVALGIIGMALLGVFLAWSVPELPLRTAGHVLGVLVGATALLVVGAIQITFHPGVDRPLGAGPVVPVQDRALRPMRRPPTQEGAWPRPRRAAMLGT